jgi:hypothetical protein
MKSGQSRGGGERGHPRRRPRLLFTADSGTLCGHTFLVIDVTGYSGTLTTGSFV